MRRLALVILDGWGLAEPGPYNAIACARTPHWDAMLAACPYGRLGASGASVGLPDGTMGNSEVGHITIGGGRVYLQPLSRIDAEITGGAYLDKPRLLQFLQEAQGTVHLMTLVSDGGVHSHLTHLLTTIEACHRHGVDDVRVHAILDGRDTPPRSAHSYLVSLEEKLEACGYAPIASVSGRFYSMDRDSRWERTEAAWRLYTEDAGADSAALPTAVEALELSYANDVADEFVVPTATRGFAPLAHGDSLFFANFRPDRARQIVRAFGEEEFTGFERGNRPHLQALLTMTDYGIPSDGVDVNYSVLLPPEQLSDTLGEVVDKAGKTQLRLAETEKYAHVTYFFSGGNEEEFQGETRKLIPSPKVATYDLAPAMRAKEIAAELVDAIRGREHHLMVTNFANGDMVGHTGEFAACIEACEVLDEVLGDLRAAAKEAGVELLITADHGNVEQMADASGVRTAHSLNAVPLVYCGEQRVTIADGGLADVAPTALALMQIEQPPAMTGKSLLRD